MIANMNTRVSLVISGFVLPILGKTDQTISRLTKITSVLLPKFSSTKSVGKPTLLVTTGFKVPMVGKSRKVESSLSGIMLWNPKGTNGIKSMPLVGVPRATISEKTITTGFLLPKTSGIQVIKWLDAARPNVQIEQIIQFWS
jgi:hypothetical protein